MQFGPFPRIPCYPLPGGGGNSTADYEELTYDAYGRMTSARLRDGNSFALSYDNLWRLTARDAPGSQPDVTYTYDNLGRLTGASQSGHSVSYTYDALSRVTSTTQAGRTLSYQAVVSRTPYGVFAAIRPDAGMKCGIRVQTAYPVR